LRGQKHTDETRIKAIELLSVYSVAEVARQLNLPENTVRTWEQGKTKASLEDKNNLVELRAKRKEEFVDSAWDSINKAKQLINRRLTRALTQESEIDNLLDKAIEEIEEEDLSDNKKFKKIQSVSGKIQSLKLEDLKELSVTLGTLYDKQALAQGDPTQNLAGTVTIETLVSKCEGDEY
jgi:predicted transcriptional regulator